MIRKSTRSDYKFLMLTLIALFALQACNGLVADVDEGKLPHAEKVLMVECYLSPQAADIEAIVSESEPMLGSVNYAPRYIPDAEVTISGEQGDIRLVYNDSLTTYRIAGSAFPIMPGKTYHLVVKQGGRTVKAQCTIPANKTDPVDITLENTGYSSYRLRALWDDIAGEANFYSLQAKSLLNMTNLEVSSDSTHLMPVRRMTTNVLTHVFDERLLVSDVNLDGSLFRSPEIFMSIPQPYELRYTDRNGDEQSISTDPLVEEIRIEVLNMDEHIFKFRRSVIENSPDNPFVEPTLLYSNITGGLGCFGAFNMGIKSFKP